MVAVTGILKVRVIQGLDLVVRDVYTSDPYVRLRLGTQQVRTQVKHNNLNPRWNEELTLATHDPSEPLKIFVYDKDWFSADDKMGEAQVDLSFLINTVKAKEGEELQEGVAICNIAATWENGLTRDSIIKAKNGQIAQKLHVRLKNVERGEVKLELKWQPYSTRKAELAVPER